MLTGYLVRREHVKSTNVSRAARAAVADGNRGCRAPVRCGHARRGPVGWSGPRRSGRRARSGPGCENQGPGAPRAVNRDRGSGEDEPEATRPPQTEIDAAVARGVAWLRKEQKRAGDFGTSPAETALALLTLRHSGVPEDDKACRRAAASLQREFPDGTVYGASVGALALIAADVTKHERKIRELVADLADAQCENGQWTYSYRNSGRVSAGDNSNTQFAILALAAARAQGISVASEPFERCHEFLLRSQNEDGGYGYSGLQRSRSYTSMTAGGAMALRLCAAVRAKKRISDPKLDELKPVKRALSWLAEHFDPAKNADAGVAFGAKKGRRSDSFWHHYWLWSVERACSVVGVETLGKHDWYTRGARRLLETQRKGGDWRDPETSLRATCFALPFFRRSTQRAITPNGGRFVTTPK